MENLEDIKVGDIIVVPNKHGGQFEVVSEVTKLFLVVTDRKLLCYTNGLVYGSTLGNYLEIRKATPQEARKYNDSLIREKVVASLKNFNWGNLPPEKIEKVYELISK